MALKINGRESRNLAAGPIDFGAERRRLDARMRRLLDLIHQPESPRSIRRHRRTRRLAWGLARGLLVVSGVLVAMLVIPGLTRPASTIRPTTSAAAGPVAARVLDRGPGPGLTSISNSKEVVAPPPPRASADAEALLATRVRRAVNQYDFGKGVIAVSVRACDDGPGPGRELVAIRADRPMSPASNLKVVTTGAALHELGPDFQFETKVIRSGNAYVLMGDGDPALGDPAFFNLLRYRDRQGERREIDEEALLGFWVDAIVRDHRANHGAGALPPIDIVIDDSIFESEGWHDGWNDNDRLKRYAAEVGGLNFHRNTFHFRPDATGGGSPDWSDMRPAAPWILASSRNRSTRVKKGGSSTAWISRSPTSNELTFRGGVKGRFSEKQDPLELTIHDPGLMLGRLLAYRLEQNGLEVTEVRRGKVQEPEGVPAIGPVIRSPIDRIVERCNEQSQNMYAEALLKRTVHEHLGTPGRWADAQETILDIAGERLGPASSGLVEDLKIDDGSGLSHDNLVTASFMTAWLDSFDDDDSIRDLFVESLSSGGDPDDGTLGRRFRDFPAGWRVDGKSGYISGVSTLSGYVTAPDGRRWTFSVLCNGVASNVRDAKALQEKVAREIANHGRSS